MARGWAAGLGTGITTHWAVLLVAGSAWLTHALVADAHTFVSQTFRAGAYPSYPGAGWVGEAFLNLPDESAVDLRSAEAFVAGRQPDFTFRTEWIDFPAGPIDSDLDAHFKTVGDFLDAYIYDVSDVSKLAEPFSHCLFRFTGFVKVTLEDEVRQLTFIGLPVWIDFGSMGYDGYRTKVGDQIPYRVQDANVAGPWVNFGPSLEVLGLFPVEITYFNNYDPDGTRGAPRAGFELYSWHGSEKNWPAGKQMTHAVFGPGTIVPPRVIYQAEDILPVARGDFDGDADVDLEDFRWFVLCFGQSFILASGCDWMDFDGDADIDLTDLEAFDAALRGP